MKKRFTSALLAFCMGVMPFTNVGSVVHAENPSDYFDGCEYVYGDCNGDSEFNLLDVILLKNWLLNVSDTKLAVWKNADLNSDGKLDVFDLCMMRDMLIESMKTYSSKKYTSKNEKYTMNFSIATDYRKRSSITVDWYDPDGDKEKTDSFEVHKGNPFKYNGYWMDDKTLGNDDYKIIWDESSVKIRFEDKDGDREVVLEYPDRTKRLQTTTTEINYKPAPEITSVDIIAESYGELSKKAWVSESGQVMSRDTVGRVGAALTVNVDNSIDSYTAVLHYDESELRWIPEKNLTVIEYNKSVSQNNTFDLAAGIELDMVNNTISFKGHKNCDYILVDAYQFFKATYRPYYYYEYEVTDITQYVSDWERMDNTGDIMKLADKEWAKANAADGTFSVSTPQELASAVYYINAIQSITRVLPRTKSKIINIELKNDIDLEGYDWKPITLFEGDLSGSSYSIKNMNITDNSLTDIGFISKAGSTSIHDISFENAVITSSQRLVHIGVAAGSRCLPGTPEFENVSITGALNINKASQNVLYGGIIGGNSESKINDCTANVLINGEKVCEYLSSNERVTAAELESGEELVSLSIDLDSMIVRRTSDEKVSSYGIVILRNGREVLERNFTKSELLDLHEIKDRALVSGEYKLYINAFLDGGYKRISNIIEYTID